MTVSSSDEHLSAATEGSRRRLPQWRAAVIWLLAAVVAVAVLSVAVAQVNPLLKKLWFPYLIFGFLTGFVLNWLATELHLRGGWWVALLGGLLCLAGSTNLVRVSYLQFRAEAEQAAREHPDQVAALQLAKSIQQARPGDVQVDAARYRLYQPVFFDYLAHRFSRWGLKHTPWPQLFWGSEALLAGIVAGLVLHFGGGAQVPRSEIDCSSPIEAQAI